MDIYFFRHGQTKGNKEKRYVGLTDEGITDKAAQKLNSINSPDVDIVYSSPLKRCTQTADIIFPENKAVIINGIKETDFGDFEYKNYEELKNNPIYISWLESGGKITFPNGEDTKEFKMRCEKAFNEIINDMEKNNYSKAAVVTHGGVIMSVFEKFYGGNFYDYQIKNGDCILGNFDMNTNRFLNIKRIGNE